MLVNTEGIVLHSFKYSDTSIIARIYTKELGLQSYLVPGARKRRASLKNNLFQPLSMFEMIVYHKERDGLQRIKEISSLNQYKTINIDIRKTTVAIFLSEVLLNCLKEQESNVQMFEFLKTSFFFFDRSEHRIADFHILFLIQLTKYLGFFPNIHKEHNKTLFNLKEGVYQHKYQGAIHCLDDQLSEVFSELCTLKYDDLGSFSLQPEFRKPLLEKTIDYYKWHMTGFRDIKSLPVLEMVFN